MRASSIQKAHSGAGAEISAFGKVKLPFAGAQPVDVVPVEMAEHHGAHLLGVKPAARKFDIQRPEVGAPELPIARVEQRQPRAVLHDQRRDGWVSASVGMNCALSAPCTADSSALRTKPRAGGGRTRH